MDTVFEVDALRARVRQWREGGQRIAFVPTMGNLHEGHLTLVDLARRAADRVIASVFVNPTQFLPGEDYDNYPRTFDADRAFLEQRGCDLLFAPSPAEVYPTGLDDCIRMTAPPDIADVLEGEFRPGHFNGVLAVVARLFNLVTPDIAVFGEKDYQQLLVMRRMTHDLGYGIEVLAAPTNRETDGLAMSSRNAYLDADQRARSVVIHQALSEAAATLRELPPAQRADAAAGVERTARARMEEAGFEVDYVAVRRADDLRPAGSGHGPLRVLAAARIGGTRLIDNLAVNSPGSDDAED